MKWEELDEKFISGIKIFDCDSLQISRFSFLSNIFFENNSKEKKEGITIKYNESEITDFFNLFFIKIILEKKELTDRFTLLNGRFDFIAARKKEMKIRMAFNKAIRSEIFSSSSSRGDMYNGDFNRTKIIDFLKDNCFSLNKKKDLFNEFRESYDSFINIYLTPNLISVSQDKTDLLWDSKFEFYKKENEDFSFIDIGDNINKNKMGSAWISCTVILFPKYYGNKDGGKINNLVNYLFFDKEIVANEGFINVNKKSRIEILLEYEKILLDNFILLTNSLFEIEKMKSFFHCILVFDIFKNSNIIENKILQKIDLIKKKIDDLNKFFDFLFFFNEKGLRMNSNTSDLWYKKWIEYLTSGRDLLPLYNFFYRIVIGKFSGIFNDYIIQKSLEKSNESSIELSNEASREVELLKETFRKYFIFSGEIDGYLNNINNKLLKQKPILLVNNKEQEFKFEISLVDGSNGSLLINEPFKFSFFRLFIPFLIDKVDDKKEDKNEERNKLFKSMDDYIKCFFDINYFNERSTAIRSLNLKEIELEEKNDRIRKLDKIIKDINNNSLFSIGLLINNYLRKIKKIEDIEEEKKNEYFNDFANNVLIYHKEALKKDDYFLKKLVEERDRENVIIDDSEIIERWLSYLSSVSIIKLSDEFFSYLDNKKKNDDEIKKIIESKDNEIKLLKGKNEELKNRNEENIDKINKLEKAKNEENIEKENEENIEKENEENKMLELANNFWEKRKDIILKTSPFFLFLLIFYYFFLRDNSEDLDDDLDDNDIILDDYSPITKKKRKKRRYKKKL